MKIVIDIDEESYEHIKAYSNEEVLPIGWYAIINGTPLPKQHGRLIYEPTKEEIEKTVGGQSDFAECIRDSVKAVFDNAPTIIKAEGSESE